MGLRPILFEIGGVAVPSYSFFVLLALVIGVLIYKALLGREGIERSNALAIALFGLLGGAIGSKVPLVIMYWDRLKDSTNLELLMSGRTIVGGLLGGMISVMLAKRILGIKVRLGNHIAIPVAVGMGIGRIGCLLGGCCYGKPTTGFWGMDLGDHVLRHPTQLMEMVFDLVLAAVLFLYSERARKRGETLKPGILFQYFLNAYMSFRFLLEFIRVEDIGYMGLTNFQWLAIVTLIYVNVRNLRREAVDAYVE